MTRQAADFPLMIQCNERRGSSVGSAAHTSCAARQPYVTAVSSNGRVFSLTPQASSPSSTFGFCAPGASRTSPCRITTSRMRGSQRAEVGYARKYARASSALEKNGCFASVDVKRNLSMPAPGPGPRSWNAAEKTMGSTRTSESKRSGCASAARALRFEISFGQRAGHAKGRLQDGAAEGVADADEPAPPRFAEFVRCDGVQDSVERGAWI